MAVQVYPEADIMYEAQNILLQQMSPAKVVRFFASWQVGRSDYLAWRDKEFAGESVGSLSEKIFDFQETTTELIAE